MSATRAAHALIVTKSSPSKGSGVIFGNGGPRPDRCTPPWIRPDGQFSVHQLQSLSHANQPQARVRDRLLRIKANSQIAHRKVDFSYFAVKVHIELLYTTVLHRIMKRLLQHTK